MERIFTESQVRELIHAHGVIEVDKQLLKQSGLPMSIAVGEDKRDGVEFWGTIYLSGFDLKATIKFVKRTFFQTLTADFNSKEDFASVIVQKHTNTDKLEIKTWNLTTNKWKFL